jgi:16S rRNA (cytidine1402-2'-O)-methyltransferase
MPGTLFVVATPIGNLEDLTFRALRTLKEVDLIAAEDTRRTSKLLAHYEIRKPLVSVREHNEAKSAARLVERLAAGESIALVSDAGTPGIADPGARLVAAVRAAGLPVIAIPGASAVAAAISICGFDASEFVFMGFPPPGGTARADWFERLDAETRPVVFFEAHIEWTGSWLTFWLGSKTYLCNKRVIKINEISVVRQIQILAIPSAARLESSPLCWASGS